MTRVHPPSDTADLARNFTRGRWHFVTLGGRTRPLAYWCKRYSLNHGVVLDRIAQGWTAWDALNTPTEFRIPGKTGDVHCFGQLLLSPQASSRWRRSARKPCRWIRPGRWRSSPALCVTPSYAWIMSSGWMTEVVGYYLNAGEETPNPFVIDEATVKLRKMREQIGIDKWCQLFTAEMTAIHVSLSAQANKK